MKRPNITLKARLRSGSCANENFAVLLLPRESLCGCEAKGREGEVVEPLVGDAVTIPISTRSCSHGTATHILPTSLLFIFLIINVVFFFFPLPRIYQQNQYLVPVKRCLGSQSL